MTEEETISLLAEMMGPGRMTDGYAVMWGMYKIAAKRLWDMAKGFGLEEDLSEIALAYELAVSSIMAKDG